METADGADKQIPHGLGGHHKNRTSWTMLVRRDSFRAPIRKTSGHKEHKGHKERMQDLYSLCSLEYPSSLVIDVIDKQKHEAGDPQ
jgi:hypothetical protein